MRTAVSLSEATALLAARPARRCVVLDLGLPDGDGAELVRAAARAAARCRSSSLSARDQEAQKIALLDAGADDYLTKPFGVGELLARMRVALRHRGTALRAGGDAVIELGDAARRPRRAPRSTRDGAPLHLTPTEFGCWRGWCAAPAGSSRTASCWPTCGAPSHVERHALPAPLHGPAARQARGRPGRAATSADRARRRLPARRRLTGAHAALMRS